MERTWKTREVADALGCADSHLASLIRRKRIPAPRKDVSGDYVWTAAEVAAARRAIAEGRRHASRR